MTIGPAPMIRIEDMSDRFGIGPTGREERVRAQKKASSPSAASCRPAPAAGKPSRRAEPYPITQGDGRDVGKTGTTAPRTGQARNTRETERRRAFVRGRLEARLGFEPSSETVQGL